MEAIESIWKEYHCRLRNFIMGRVKDDNVADDILQDVFMKVLAKLDSLEDTTKIKSWLFRITRNTIIDYFRAKKPSEELPDNLERSDDAALSRDEQEMVGNCLVPLMDNLPDNYREAVKMSELEGTTQQEVAEAQDISLSGAKSRVQRGRAMMKQMLEDCCHFEFDQAGRVSDYAQKSEKSPCGKPRKDLRSL